MVWSYPTGSIRIYMLFIIFQNLVVATSAQVRGANTLERKVASPDDRTHDHQVMRPTRSPLSHPGGARTNLIKTF